MPLNSTKNRIIPAAFTPERLSMYVCPILLGCTLCFSTVYALYREMSVLYTVMFLAVMWLLFALFDRLKQRPVRGGLIYTAMLIVSIVLSVYLIIVGTNAARDEMAFLEWFFGAEGSDNRQPLFLNSVFIGGGFFIISVLYYFTQIRYRTMGVMLCILFPFVIYARRNNVMPELMVTIIVALYLAVVVHNRRTDPARPEKTHTITHVDRAYIISIAIFVSVTGAVAMSVPKPAYVSRLERDTGYSSSMGLAGTGNARSLESTNTMSDRRYGKRSYTGEILFKFATNGTNEVYYLRKQPYETFNGSVWTTDTSSPYNQFYYNNTSYTEYGTPEILGDMQAMIFNNTVNADPIPANVLLQREGILLSETFAPVYLPVPLGTMTDNLDPDYKKYWTNIIMRYPRFSTDVPPLNDRFTFYDQEKALYEYADTLDMSNEDFWGLFFENDDDEAARLVFDYRNARLMYSDMSNVSEDIIALSLDITKDLHSDYDKAAALEKYFLENGFVYDTEYTPDDESIDYFIFKGKTGVCTSYATAMTLMARSAGLTARYVEGFAAFERNDSGEFIVRDRHAHAFVEVYIPGAGWLTFDPTVPDYRNIENEDDNTGAGILSVIMNRFLIVGIVAAFIVISLLRSTIMEYAFRTAQLFRDPKNKTIKLYANVVRRMNNKEQSDLGSYTVNMLREHINETSGSVPEKLFSLYERTAFGGYRPTIEEYREAYKEYKSCMRL